MAYPAELAPYRDVIETASRQFDLDHALLAGLILFESGGNPQAVSAAGAIGLGQVMPAEAGFPGRPTRQQLLNPEVNATWASRILSDGIQRWGTVDQGLAAYLGAINARGQITGGDPYTGVSGQEYVRRVHAQEARVAAALEAEAGAATVPVLPIADQPMDAMAGTAEPRPVVPPGRAWDPVLGLALMGVAIWIISDS